MGKGMLGSLAVIGKASIAIAALSLVSASSMIGCAPRARMCTATSECAKENACVAGRCQPDKPTVKPAVDSARRWVVSPSDLAYVKKGDPAGDGALPPLFALGRSNGVLFLRFSVALPANANVIEAYVCLRRATVVDDDPAPITLHATRIIDSWEGRSTSWAFQPRVREVRTPATIVEPGGPGLVRIDVRDLVRQWAKRDPQDQGIAIVAENESRTGTTFALSSVGADRSPGFEVGGPSPSDRSRTAPPVVSAPDVAPYLELYVR
jgi:hypothetical protein